MLRSANNFIYLRQNVGAVGPYFISLIGMDVVGLRSIVDSVLQELDLFLVEFDVSPSNRIKLLVDSVEGVRLEQLAKFSRALESELDREQEDFALEVSSPGVGEPLKVKEQYIQNIGRKLKVKTAEGEHSGRLAAFENDELVLTFKERVPKEVGKGKVTVERALHIAFEGVKEARVQVEF